METILFYEKPGCQNNTRQKKILELSGDVVKSVSLLDHPWTKEELAHYLGGKPVAECFNPAAPAIKSGLVNPRDFTKDEALEAMIKEPILIKRPLMKIGIHCIQGFDPVLLQNLINLQPVQVITDLNSCPHTENSSCIKQEH